MPAKLEGYLELKNITFGYSRLAPPLLENFSISMRQWKVHCRKTYQRIVWAMGW